MAIEKTSPQKTPSLPPAAPKQPLPSVAAGKVQNIAKTFFKPKAP